MTKPTTYRHTQIGWLTIVVLGCIALGGLVKIVVEPSAGGVIGLALAAVGLVLFSTLTVVADDDGIEVRFGPGPIRRRLRWADIRSSRPVRNGWLTGWGIRWTGSGWMYNVSGRDAVELVLDHDRTFRIGTDDVAGLQAVVRDRLAQRSA